MTTDAAQLTAWVIKLGGEVRSLQQLAGRMETNGLNKEITRCQTGLHYIYKQARQTGLDLMPYYDALADIEARLRILQTGLPKPPPFEKVALFIDGPNLAKTCQDQLKRRVDYAKLLNYFAREAIILRAFYYTAIDNEEDVHRNPFLVWLKRNGYQVVTKIIKGFDDGTRKGDLDVDIALDMLELADKVDRVILLSGDGDFAPLLKRVGMKGARTQVVSHWGRGEGATAAELLDATDVFLDLTTIIDQIARE